MFIDLNRGGRRIPPRFSVMPPLVIPVIIVVIILTAISTGLTFQALNQQQRLEVKEEKLADEVQQHQRAARDILARTQREQQASATAITLLTRVTPIGKVLTKDVAITQLDASLDNQSIRIEVKAESLAALLDFSLRLEQSQASVELKNHRPEKESHDRWPVGATLVVTFPGAAS